MGNSKRIISLFLTVLMVLTSVPFTAFSVDGCAHEWDAGVVSIEATCTQDGEATYTCGLCNGTKTETIPALGHDFDETIEENVTIVLETCTQDGSKTVKCSRCDETKVTVLEKTGHTPVIDAKVDPTCTATGLTEGSHCSVCDAVLTAQDVIAVLGHDFDETIEENVTIVPATCTQDGSKTVNCSRCDETKVTVLEKTGHTPATDAKVDPTCTATGLTEGSHCSVCGEVLTAQDVIAVLGHDFDDSIEENVTVVPATCTQDGSKTVKCSRCDETEVTVLEKTGHTSVIDAKVDPTCTATGLTEGSHCSVCDAVLTAQDVIAALGHDFDETIEENVTIVPAMCTQDGSKTVKCSRCDATNVTVLTQSGHVEYSDPVWTWTADLESGSAVATFTCLKDDDVQTPEVTVTSAVTKAPTCTETGVLTYTAKTTFRDVEYTDTYDVVIPATGHEEYSAPVWTWTADLESGSAVATFTCLKDDDVQTPEVTVTSEVTLAPTCTGTGVLTYTAKTTFRDVEYTDTYDVVIPATTHLEYSGPVWTWEGDENGATAVATFTCLEGDDVQTPEVTITDEITTEPTCTQTGVKTYTAVVTFRDVEYTDAYDVVASATGHVEYSAPVWSWTADLESGSAVATFTCLKDDDVQTLEVTVTSEVTLAPTCTQTGILTYTAKTTFRDVEYTDTYDVVIPATTHLEYSGPVWTWEGDENGATAEAAFTCLEGDDVQKPEVTITDEITKEPTCTQTGIKTYTAVVTFRDVEYTDTYDVVASATGHVEYADPVWNWNESKKGVVTVDVSFTCLKEDDIQTPEITVTDAITTEPTCVLTGIRTYTAVTVFRGVEYVSTYDQVVAAKGHKKVVTIQPQVATCTEPGHTAEVMCTVCNEVLNPCEPVPAAGHNTYARIKAKAATCTEDGRTAELKCLTCGTITQVSEVIPATGHDYQIEKVVDRTCTTEGYTVYTCANCRDTYNANIVLPTGHNYIVTEDVAATCTTGGYKRYSCTNCGDTYTDDVVEALGHDIIIHLARPSTCIEKGWDEYQTCSRCDYNTFHELELVDHKDINRDGACDVCKLQMSCGHVCHYDNFIGKLYRFFYSLATKLTGKEHKCCPDMELMF